MKKSLSLFIAILTVVSLTAFVSNKKSLRILVFSRTLAFHHASIPTGIAAIQKIGKDNNLEVDTTTDANYFNSKQLGKYAAVVF